MKKKDLLFTITGVLYANNESGSDPHILHDGMLLLLFAKCSSTIILLLLFLLLLLLLLLLF